MARFFLLSVVSLFGLFFSSPLSAEETIGDFNVIIRINPDSSLEVTEEITYGFGAGEAAEVRRYLPTKYEAGGEDYDLRLGSVTVAGGDGKPRVFRRTAEDGFERIDIAGVGGGEAGGQEILRLSYKVERAIGFFGDRDELYWQVTGSRWPVTIEKTKLVVMPPGDLPAGGLKAECFAGASGGCVSSRFDYASRDTVRKIIFADDSLEPGSGLVAVVTLPKGAVKPPAIFKKAAWAVRDNWFFGAAAIFFAGLAFWRRRKAGEKPKSEP